ncbi:hypothetical protein GSI_02400 [Ganoderma sinense ZZ0214-1]|uniref:F-box domain-containing protein n=1 Tax=Ganoderma sinense ZZ0214-1 TaxID=1077348 RepID=A0A2G8SPJ2_9APHY|nr:hypothetical protein GSI_02400 [Ganoderma sinense ZZ0214-1]
MSCSLCRLPFTPSPSSMAPRWPPDGILSDKQLQYMKHAVGMGQYLVGLVVNLVHLDNNMFTINNSPVLVTIVWETGNKTFIALHTHCAMFFRHNLGLTSDCPGSLIECSLIDTIVGPTQGGAHAGRLNDVDYEGVLGDGSERVDIESLWSKGPSEGNAHFDWQEWKQRGLEWTAARPDVFPRFRPTILEARLSSVGERMATTDIITTQSLDILHILLPYLSNKSYVNLIATCRTLRYHALTTFQPHARVRVLSLGWAVPLESEYINYVHRMRPDLDIADSQPEPATEGGTQPPIQSSPPSPTDGTSPVDDAGLETRLDAMSLSLEPMSSHRASRTAILSQLEMAHAAHSPVHADWLHYLSRVHRTPAMRARRWVWALAEAVAQVYRRKRAEGPFADLEPDDDDSDEEGGLDPEQREKWGKLPRKSDAWNAYAQSVMQQLVMRRLVQGAGAGNGRGPRFTW